LAKRGTSAPLALELQYSTYSSISSTVKSKVLKIS